MKTLDLGNGKLVEMASDSYYFHSSTYNYNETDFDFYNRTAKQYPVQVGSIQIVPEGRSNNFSMEIRALLEGSNLGEGILNRQRGLHLGQGIGMYQDITEDDSKTRKWLIDKDVEKWLKDWDLHEYVINSLVDFLHRPQFYSKVFRNKGVRTGRTGKIAKLEHIPDQLCRREWPDTVAKMTGIPKRVLINDWNNDEDSMNIVYNGFDKREPLKHPVSVAWVHLHQYSRTQRDYVIPQWWGAQNWMKNSNNVPKIIDSLNKNMLNIKWHIVSPQAYWDKKRDLLQEQCNAAGTEYKESMLEDLKDQVLQGLASVLTGVNNVGKFFHSESVMQVLELGRPELLEWKIIPIDMKVKAFIDSQIGVGDKADSATTSGMGLHPSLSNIMVDGKLASGSEQLYAYKLFLATEPWLIEQKVFELINMAIRVNFPRKQTKVGFYHDIMKREEEITPDDRVLNNDN